MGNLKHVEQKFYCLLVVTSTARWPQSQAQGREGQTVENEVLPDHEVWHQAFLHGRMISALSKRMRHLTCRSTKERGYRWT